MCKTVRSRFQIAAMAGAVALVGGVMTQRASAQLTALWDTGVEHPFSNNCTLPGTCVFLGYSSGNIAGAPQRWTAQPFKIDSALYPAGATVTEIHVHGFYVAGNEPQDMVFIIWRRFGNTARLDPVLAVSPNCGGSDAICNTGLTTGAHMEAPANGDQVTPAGGIRRTAILTGETDPRGGFGGALFKYKGLCQPLAAGDYYLTAYGDGFRAGNTSGFSNFAWFGGADLQDNALKRTAMWRSVTFPAPGFAQYNPAALCSDPACPALADPTRDLFSTAFAIYGFPPGPNDDCNTNTIADYCEPGYADCDNNNVADFCQIALNPGLDCNSNHTIDSCELGAGNDCTTNGTPDQCEAGYADCNANGVADICDIAGGETDCNVNGIPDICEADCNTNGHVDYCDIHGCPSGPTCFAVPQISQDCNNNGIPDECEQPQLLMGLDRDCNTNGTLDSCEFTANNHHCENCALDFCNIDHGAPNATGSNLTDFFSQFLISTDNIIALLPSDLTTNCPLACAATDTFFCQELGPGAACTGIATTAGDLLLTCPSDVTDIHVAGGYEAASLGGPDATMDAFRISIYSGARPSTGVCVQRYNLLGTTPGAITRYGAATNQIFDYILHLPTAVHLSANTTYWVEVAYNSTTNTNNWGIAADDGNSTVGGSAAHVILSVSDTGGTGTACTAGTSPSYGFNWIFNTPVANGGHLLIDLYNRKPDANTNGIPDACENVACPTCPGDLNGDTLVDGRDIQGMVTDLVNHVNDPCADVNGDGAVNALDVPLFAGFLLYGGNCGEKLRGIACGANCAPTSTYCLYTVNNVAGGGCGGLPVNGGTICVLCEQGFPGGLCPNLVDTDPDPNHRNWNHFDANGNVICSGRIVGPAGTAPCNVCPATGSFIIRKR